MVGNGASIRAAAEHIADAIRRRDLAALADALAPGFEHRTPGGGSMPADRFLDAVRSIPGEILSVELQSLHVDEVGDSGVLTGVQHARVRMDGAEIEDRRGFVDVFVNVAGAWRLRVAVDVPLTPSP